MDRRLGNTCNLKDILADKHGLIYDLAEIDQIVKQGYCSYKGQQYPIRQEVEEAAEPVVNKIIAETQARIDLSRDADYAVVASGGACIDAAAQLFQNRLGNFIVDVGTVPDPMANVRGYGKLGVFLDKMGKFR